MCGAGTPTHRLHYGADGLEGRATAWRKKMLFPKNNGPPLAGRVSRLFPVSSCLRELWCQRICHGSHRRIKQTKQAASPKRSHCSDAPSCLLFLFSQSSRVASEWLCSKLTKLTLQTPDHMTNEYEDNSKFKMKHHKFGAWWLNRAHQMLMMFLPWPMSPWRPSQPVAKEAAVTSDLRLEQQAPIRPDRHTALGFCHHNASHHYAGF